MCWPHFLLSGFERDKERPTSLYHTLLKLRKTGPILRILQRSTHDSCLSVYCVGSSGMDRRRRRGGGGVVVSLLFTSIYTINAGLNRTCIQ